MGRLDIYIYGQNAFLGSGTAHWGNAGVFGSDDPDGMTALWGKRALWGKGTPEAANCSVGKQHHHRRWIFGSLEFLRIQRFQRELGYHRGSRALIRMQTCLSAARAGVGFRITNHRATGYELPSSPTPSQPPSLHQYLSSRTVFTDALASGSDDAAISER